MPAQNSLRRISLLRAATRPRPCPATQSILAAALPGKYRSKSDITPVFTRGAMAPVGPYSQAVIAPPSPRLVFCSGQLPATATGELVTTSMADKTQACIQALAAVLDEAGSSLDRIVKTTVFLADREDFAEMNVVYEKLITHKPARSCVAVKQLPKGVDIEIECIAVA